MVLFIANIYGTKHKITKVCDVGQEDGVDLALSEIYRKIELNAEHSSRNKPNSKALEICKMKGHLHLQYTDKQNSPRI